MRKRTTILREGVTSQRASILQVRRRPPRLSGPSIAYNCNPRCSALWHSPLLPLMPPPSSSVPAPSQIPVLSLTPVPAPSTQAPSPRDLQRQQEVRDSLSGKPGPKASSLIEMYREKERQASSGSGNSPGKFFSATSIVKQQQHPQQRRSTTVEKGSTHLSPRPLPRPLNSLSFPMTPQ